MNFSSPDSLCGKKKQKTASLRPANHFSSLSLSVCVITLADTRSVFGGSHSLSAVCASFVRLRTLEDERIPSVSPGPVPLLPPSLRPCPYDLERTLKGRHLSYERARERENEEWYKVAVMKRCFIIGQILYQTGFWSKATLYKCAWCGPGLETLFTRALD